MLSIQFTPIFANLPAPVQNAIDCAWGSGDGSIGLKCGQMVSSAVSQAWGETWNTFLGDPPSGIYIALINIARLLAVCTLMYFIVHFLRDWIEDNAGIPPLPQLGWVIVLLILMNNNGSLLRQVSVEIRDIINGVNNQVLAVTNASNQLENRLSELGDYPQVEGYIRNARAKCIGMTDNRALTECLKTERESIDQLLTHYRTVYPGSRWVNQLSRMADNLFQNLPDDPLSTVLSIPGLVLRPVQNATTSVGIQTWLAGMQGAFQYLIEISFLLTAMIAPIPLGLTLMPIGAKPIYLWFTTMLSLGLCKLCLNIITAIATTALYQSGPFDNNTNMLVLGLLAPILAFSLSVGGGMAIFNAIAAAARSVVSTASVGIIQFSK